MNNTIKQPYTLLIVEDEEPIRKNYVTYLEMLFQKVYEADNGEKAYEIYQKYKPDILILDIHLPKMTGLELLKKIRQKDYNTKAIMLTAHSDKAFLLDAVSLKLTRYLIKPVARKELKEALEASINELKEFTLNPTKLISLKDNYTWDVELKELKYYQEIIELTSKEKKLLELLFSKKDKTFSYDEIFDYFWKDLESFTYNSLKNMVKRLRKKLPEDTISNIFNEGYKINF